MTITAARKEVEVDMAVVIITMAIREAAAEGMAVMEDMAAAAT